MSTEKSELAKFEICCPLYPLFPRGEGYPPNYALPPRMRPNDCLNLKKLTSILKESLLFAEKSDENEEVSVVSVLSPYSHDLHVMIMDLSPELYLPSPELIDLKIFNKICGLANECINYMRMKHSKCICAGYNWSPFSYGKFEEVTGGQSITTKFHFSLWTWDDLQKFDAGKSIKREYRRALGENEYGLPFARFFYDKIQKIVDDSCLFDAPELTSNCLFIPFKPGVTISDALKDGVFVKEIASVIASNLRRLSETLSDSNISEMIEILKNTEKRLLTENEISTLRRVPKIYPLDDCLSKCQDKNERDIITALYQPAVNREKEESEDSEYWKKNFSYSLSFCESEIKGIKSGMRIFSLPQCGPGGVIESFRCVLTRPEKCVASNEDVIRHNNILWDLADYLKEKL